MGIFECHLLVRILCLYGNVRGVSPLRPHTPPFAPPARSHNFHYVGSLVPSLNFSGSSSRSPRSLPARVLVQRGASYFVSTQGFRRLKPPRSVYRIQYA